MTDATNASSDLFELCWGSHLCHFYDSHGDLADVVVPYFTTGLANNEAGLWMTSAPLRAAEARARLAQAVPDFVEREGRGQIEIVDYDQWISGGNALDIDGSIDALVERKERALQQGFSGLRISGNTFHGGDFDALIAYEARLDEVTRDDRLILLCSYCLEECTSNATLSLLRRHESAISVADGALRRLESEQLERGRRVLDRMRRKLEREREAERSLLEADKKKDEFLIKLGHELRNPLASILTTTQLIGLRGGDKEYRKELGIIERQVANITSIVNDLVDVSLVTAGRVKLDTGPVEAAEVVNQAVETLAPPLEESRHRLHVDCPSAGLRINGDLTRLVQVVTNLLTNAIHYTPPGGDISIAAGRAGNDIVLSVTDTGRGIDPQTLATIFEPFNRGNGGDQRHKSGLGLGLSIVRSLVDLHHGTVDVASEVGKGSRFVVTLPAHE